MPHFDMDSPEGTKRILVLNGPNLNLLGYRKPEVYGEQTLFQIERYIAEYAETLEPSFPLEVSFYQANGEGTLIDTLQNARTRQYGIIFNPGAYAHYSYALRDCIEGINLPVVEVHLTDTSAREDFRKVDVLADVCLASFVGMGPDGYCRALDLLIERIENELRSEREENEGQEA